MRPHSTRGDEKRREGTGKDERGSAQKEGRATPGRTPTDDHKGTNQKRELFCRQCACAERVTSQEGLVKCPPSGQRAKHSTSRAVGGQWAGGERTGEEGGVVGGGGGGGLGLIHADSKRLYTTVQ